MNVGADQTATGTLGHHDRGEPRPGQTARDSTARSALGKSVQPSFLLRDGWPQYALVANRPVTGHEAADWLLQAARRARRRSRRGLGSAAAWCPPGNS
jgi:hypothetical protein